MSQGLGSVQRTILEVLDATPTMAAAPFGPPRDAPAAFLGQDGFPVALEHVYAVRRVRQQVAAQRHALHWHYAWHTVGVHTPQWEAQYQYPTRSLHAAFSRALYGLIARGLLRVVLLQKTAWPWITWQAGIPRDHGKPLVTYIAKW